MGQLINVTSSVIDNVVVFDTDRTIAGQDGASYARSTVVEDGTFPGRLAGRLFSTDDTIDHAWIAGNQVVVRRSGGWDDAAVEAVGTLISEFFQFYPTADRATHD